MQFVSGEIEYDLSSVPGIGPAGVKALKAAGVDNTFQLFGKILMLKPTMKKGEEDDATQMHCDAVWHWLNDAGINAHRAGVVTCLMEKLETMVPLHFPACAPPPRAHHPLPLARARARATLRHPSRATPHT